MEPNKNKRLEPLLGGRLSEPVQKPDLDLSLGLYRCFTAPRACEPPGPLGFRLVMP